MNTSNGMRGLYMYKREAFIKVFCHFVTVVQIGADNQYPKLIKLNIS